MTELPTSKGKHSAPPKLRYRTVEGTVWPVNLVGDEDTYGLENRLRYPGEPLTTSERLVLASVVAAYVYLTNPDLGPTAARDAFRRARLAAKEARDVAASS